MTVCCSSNDEFAICIFTRCATAIFDYIAEEVNDSR
jgi:hypothetical protein